MIKTLGMLKSFYLAFILYQSCLHFCLLTACCLCFVLVHEVEGQTHAKPALYCSTASPAHVCSFPAVCQMDYFQTLSEVHGRPSVGLHVHHLHGEAYNVNNIKTMQTYRVRVPSVFQKLLEFPSSPHHAFRTPLSLVDFLSTHDYRSSSSHSVALIIISRVMLREQQAGEEG